MTTNKDCIRLSFEVVVLNGFIDFLDISPLLFINKDIYTFTNQYIDTHCTNYFSKKVLIENTFLEKKTNKKPQVCTTCYFRHTRRVNPFHSTPLCKKCTPKKIIHKSTAKKQYKIKDIDLDRLPYHCYHRSRYTLGYIYDLPTIQYVSLLYKIQKAKQDYLCPPKPPLKSVRETRVRSFIQEYQITDTDQQYHILSCRPIFYYIQNGSYGIRRVKQAIEQWKDFYQFMHHDKKAFSIIHDLNINEYFEKFIQDKKGTIDLIYEKHEFIMIRREREKNIMDRLKEYDIDTEYKCDAYYKYITNPHTDLEECILSIRERHFFLVHTDYLERRKLRLQCLQVRRYIPPEEVEELIERAEVDAKQMALYSVSREDIPDFIKLKYLYRK